MAWVSTASLAEPMGSAWALLAQPARMPGSAPITAVDSVPAVAVVVDAAVRAVVAAAAAGVVAAEVAVVEAAGVVSSKAAAAADVDPLTASSPRSATGGGCSLP